MVREGLIVEIICRVRPITSEGASHEEVRDEARGSREECFRQREQNIKYPERGKSLVYLRN